VKTKLPKEVVPKGMDDSGFWYWDGDLGNTLNQVIRYLRDRDVKQTKTKRRKKQ